MYFNDFNVNNTNITTEYTVKSNHSGIINNDTHSKRKYYFK